MTKSASEQDGHGHTLRDPLSLAAGALAKRMNRRGFLGNVGKGSAIAAAGMSGLFSVAGVGTDVKSALAYCCCWHCYSCQSVCVCNDSTQCSYQYYYCDDPEQEILWATCATDCRNHYLSCNDCCRAFVPYGDFQTPDYWSCPCWTNGCMC